MEEKDKSLMQKNFKQIIQKLALKDYAAQSVQYGKEEELTVEKYDKHYTYLGDQS